MQTLGVAKPVCVHQGPESFAAVEAGEGQSRIVVIHLPSAAADPCFPKIHCVDIKLSHKFDIIGRMRTIALLIVCSVLAGCMSNKKSGMAYIDAYDGVQVEQTMGNSVSAAPLQKTIVCLNPRRETRRVSSVSNQVVSAVTNVSLVYVTNQTVTATTNMSRTLSTNQFALPALPTAPTTNETVEAGANVETNTVATLPPQAPPPNSTNNTVTTTANITMSRAPSQTSLTANHQQLLNRQITLNTTTVNLITADNDVVTIETNIVVNVYTNQAVTAVTNYNVIYTNIFVRDYYVYAEFTPPQDFTLQNTGESLILLVDGVRHGLVASGSQTAFVARRGYQSTLYRVPPELIADIANAKEVKMRIKGVNSVIERKLNEGSRSNFRRFMLKYFTPNNEEQESQPAANVRQANLETKYETN